MGSTVIRVPGKKINEFKKLFYTKEEWKNISEEVRSEASGWRDKIKAQGELGSIDMIKEDVFLKTLQNKLLESGVKDPKFKGFLTVIDEDTLKLDLGIKCKSPSFLYSLIFDEHIQSLIRIECKEYNDETEIKMDFPLPKIFELAGCLIMIVLFAAFIIPGLLWLQMMNSVKRVSKTVREDAFVPALKERLSF